MKRISLPSSAKAFFYPSFPESAHACLVANEWLKSGNQCLVLITESITKAESWGEDVAGITEQLSPGLTFRFHLFDEAPDNRHPDAFDRICERTSVLSLLGQFTQAGKGQEKLIIATTPEALRSPCPIFEHNRDSELKISTGEEIDFSRLPQKLAEDLGYSSEILCEEPGQFAVRGGIIDVYPVNATTPYRVDFFGDEVEEIKTFDPTTQRTDKPVSSIRISSSNEEGHQLKEGAFFAYIQTSTTWVLQEPELMISQFPLCFHVSKKAALGKITLSEMWLNRKIEKDKFLGLSEIDAGSGIFESSERKLISVQASIKAGDLQSNALDMGKVFENEENTQTLINF